MSEKNVEKPANEKKMGKNNTLPFHFIVIVGILQNFCIQQGKMN